MVSNQKPESRFLDVARLIVMQLTAPVLLALFMFWPAGTIWWTRGWVFLLTFALASTASAIFLQRVNPEVVVARSRFHQGTKAWDRIVVAFLFPLFFAIISVAALDDSRFHWCPQSWWVCGFGYAIMCCGFAGLIWATAVNRFFEPTVRIQTDRGHTVVTNGPYAIVRHPGYAFALPMFVGIALAMGSLWALIPAVLTWLVLAVRTQLEDSTLRAELPGYAEYAQQVRYKLIPGVW